MDKITVGLKQALDFARGIPSGKPGCQECGGSGYIVEHIETTVWRERITYDTIAPANVCRDELAYAAP